eukprot:403348588
METLSVQKPQAQIIESEQVRTQADIESSFMKNLLKSNSLHMTEAAAAIKQFSENGEAAVENSIKQLECLSPQPIKDEIIMNFGLAQFQRANPYRVLDKLTFSTLSDDLYKAYQFAEQSKGFNIVQFGNHEFKLLTKTDEEVDNKNLATLHLLLSKTKGLILNRLYTTFEILEYLIQNIDKYQNIESLTIDYSKNYDHLIEKLSLLVNVKELNLIQTFFDDGQAELDRSSVQLIKNMPNLVKLTLIFNKSSSIHVIKECKEYLLNLQELDIGISNDKEQDDLLDILDILKEMKQLRKLRISSGVANYKVLNELDQIEEFEVNSDICSLPIKEGDFMNLSKLTLCSLQLEMIPDLLLALINSQKLKELDISYELRGNNQPLEDFLQRNKSVEVLKIKKAKILDRFKFLTGLKDNTTLKHLYIELLRTDLQAADKVLPFENLENHSLETLQIKGSAQSKQKYNMPNDYFGQLIEMLKGLKSFEVSNFLFLKEQFELIVKALTSNPNLKNLGISQSQFKNPDNLNQLLVAFTEAKGELKILNLSQSINLNHFQGVLELLRLNKSLQRIDLEQSEFENPERLYELFDTVGNHPTLLYLNIAQSKFSDQKLAPQFEEVRQIIIKNSQNLQYLQFSDKLAKFETKDYQTIREIQNQCPKMMEFRV